MPPESWEHGWTRIFFIIINVIPAKAGIQATTARVDTRVRGNDE
jgi:hypothetical protein